MIELEIECHASGWLIRAKVKYETKFSKVVERVGTTEAVNARLRTAIDEATTFVIEARAAQAKAG